MPIDPDAVTEVVGFCKVPDFAKGHVRDIRVRWALEEIGRPYRTTLLDAFAKRPPEHVARQPFGQVPVLADGKVELFESGAILLYLGEQDERLLPREPEAHWRALTWLFAGFSSVEPAVMQYVWIGAFNAGTDWSAAAKPDALQFVGQRVKRLSDALAGQEWLAGAFSIADIVMVTVLRNLSDHVLGEHPGVLEYRQRGEARPAFQRALADQLAGFIPEGADA
jgi:glutathione S-transferase